MGRVFETQLHWTERKAQAMQNRLAETDEEFLTRCDLPSLPRALEIPTAIRRAIATHAGVKPELIHADDRIPEDLVDIFFRESPDVVEFLILLEKDLRVRLPDSAGYFACRETVTVKEIVNSIYSVLI